MTIIIYKYTYSIHIHQNRFEEMDFIQVQLCNRRAKEKKTVKSNHNYIFELVFIKFNTQKLKTIQCDRYNFI